MVQLTMLVLLAAAAPGQDVVVAREKSAYEAWKSHDAKIWDTFLWDKFTGWGSSGRFNKASAAKEFTGLDCEIKSFGFSEEHVTPLGSGAVLLTHVTKVQGTCGGQAVPDSRAASIYVRVGGTWKDAFHTEGAVVDPKAAPVAPVVKEGPSAEDAGAGDLLAIEREVWEAWRVHDVKRIAELTAKDISFINIFGTYLPTKAEALKDWSAPGCDVKAVRITDAAKTMLSPTAGILTFHAAADGTCYGQKVGPIWSSSVYVKEGDTWKWKFGINIPAQ